MYNSTVNDRNMESFRSPINILELASRMVDKQILSDNSSSTLIDIAGINNQCGPSASGLTDNDYPNLNGLSKNFANINQLKLINKTPLPPEVMEHFANMQCQCRMGLFPEINRAWLTIDSDIYVWTYEHGSDVAYYDGLGETIISVGLVKPKPGVFHQFINYLMILTTTVEIVVLGVTFNTNVQIGNITSPQDEINLVPEPIFVLPTDGISITTIIGTDKGRIFLGGRDGSLFEIMYQAQGSWFGKRCKKVNHSTGTLSFLVPSFLNAFNDEDPVVKMSVDNSRNILYLLTEKGSIEVYDLGDSGETICRIVKISQASIIQNALNIVKTLDSTNFRPIVSISAVNLKESPFYHLVAVAQTGVRFYFTTIHLNVNSSAAQAYSQRPVKLQLIHVRLPPGFSANAPAIRPKMVHLAHYRSNTLIMTAQPTPEQNHLWCLSSDPFPFLPILMEAYTIMPLDGRVWALQEVPFEDPLASNVLLKKDKSIMPPNPPLVVRQHYEPASKFIILTGQGAHIIMKLRPVDLLREILIDSKGPDSEFVKAFFQTQKEDQAAATCLILACLEGAQNMQIAEWATRAFFMYGGETKISGPMPNTTPQFTNVAGFSPGFVSTPIPPHRMQQTMQTPQANTTFGQNTLLHSENINNQMQFSAKHDGLYLYVGRILRDLWYTHCCRKFNNDNKTYLISIVTGDDCLMVLSYLRSLRTFLDKNTLLAMNSNVSATTKSRTMINPNETFSSIVASPHSTALQNSVRLTAIQDAQLEERHSLDALKLFVNHTCEVLGLWKILTEHQFHLIVDTLSKEHQNQLLNATFKDLFVNGFEILSYLIVNLINSYLNDNASVDLISRKLREVCPNLYKNEDAVCSKANEILIVSKKKNNPHEKQELLSSALNLCKDVSPNLNLPVVCQKFISNEFYEGVLDLCVTCAQKSDEKNIGLHYYKSNKTDPDDDGYQAYARRMQCYKEVALMLNILYESNAIDNNSSTIETNYLIKDVIGKALEYKDELLHITIYNWMLEHQMFSELISISEPSLEQYLIRATKECADPLQIYDLLWKYYEHNKNHPAAAKVLNALATEPGETVNLSKRIEYLAHSVICMRSDKVGYAAPLGVFLRELEDRIQIARVQQKILDAIINTRSAHPRAEDSIKLLNSKLLDITDLYEQFAEQYELWECKLAIVHCSGHDDPALIQNIWENIIASEFKLCCGSPDDKMTQLLSKIQSLYREFGDSENCFPLRIIINLLEIQCCKISASPSMVPNRFLDMNIPLNRLMDTYKTLLKERIAGNLGNPFHMFEAVAYLVQEFVNDPSMVSHLERIKIVTKAEDIVSSALSSLYSKPNTDQIIIKLKTIQSSLKRLSNF